MNSVEVIKANKTRGNRNHDSSILRVAAYCRVSTDSEDQLNSYKSQVKHYQREISKNKKWKLVDIYADEAITGTQVKKREDFQRLINDCMNGLVDMVITKSISRFARNTLDTLKYVRKLKENNIAVLFEDEKINTLTMDGELLLVVLSSVAQQEVENISANVKKGLEMKMKRGELVGSHKCLGYDYNSDKKEISINEEEAKIVKYIFERYLDGAGCGIIKRELMNLGYKTKKGNTQWHDTTVLGILKNEKYKGDIIQGKTYTLDPISKRRLTNLGEVDKYILKDHHEPIISPEDFNKVQEIRLNRAMPRKLNISISPPSRIRMSRMYALSSMIECGFCGKMFSRRSWHANSPNQKVVWQCSSFVKGGKKHCPHYKGIEEKVIMTAFVESYNRLSDSYKNHVSDYLEEVSNILDERILKKQLSKIEEEIKKYESKLSKLVDIMINDGVENDIYSIRHSEISNKLKKLKQKKSKLRTSINEENDIQERLIKFRDTLEKGNLIEEFDRRVFESIVDKIVIGDITNDKVDPYRITFVFKTGETSTKDALEIKGTKREKMCSKTNDSPSEMYSNTKSNTC